MRTAGCEQMCGRISLAGFARWMCLAHVHTHKLFNTIIAVFFSLLFAPRKCKNLLFFVVFFVAGWSARTEQWLKPFSMQTQTHKQHKHTQTRTVLTRFEPLSSSLMLLWTSMVLIWSDPHTFRQKKHNYTYANTQQRHFRHRKHTVLNCLYPFFVFYSFL